MIAVKTPLGCFKSLIEAAKAHNIPPWAARREYLARRWSRWELGKLYTAPERHGHKRAIITPSGCFNSASAAAKAHGISKQAASYKALRNINGWKYQ